MKYVASLLSLSLLSIQQVISEKPKLSDFAFNDYSQSGEDGIIDKIFSIIEPKSKTCVEFGAWDGFHLSNTARLWAKYGWRGILIEGNTERFKIMQKKTKPYASNLTLINQWVGYDNNNCIDSIVLRVGIKDVDLMSIDIDSDDYYIAQSISHVKPRVVMCEYNPTIPADIDIYQEHGQYLGCSVSALNRVLLEKGYHLVALTVCNAFFVLNEDAKKLEALFETSLHAIRVDKLLCYLVTTYDGKPFLVKKYPEIPYGIQKSGYTGTVKRGDQSVFHFIQNLNVSMAPSTGKLRLIRQSNKKQI